MIILQGYHNLTGYYGQLGTDPLLQDIFGDYQFINKGGRVGAMSGLFTGDMVNEEYLPEMSLEEKALQELKDRYSGIRGLLLEKCMMNIQTLNLLIRLE
jgi:hypothetical protein